MEIDWHGVGYVALFVWALIMPVVVSETVGEPGGWLSKVISFTIASGTSLFMGGVFGLLIFG